MLRRPRTTGIALALLAATYLSGCGEGEPTGTTVTVARVEVSPQTVTLAALGETRAFSAVAKDANGNTMSGQTFTWTSSATGVATVAANGTATAVGNGTATITAITAGVSGSASLTVTQVAATVDVTPGADTLTAIGDTLRFSAAAKDANDNTITDQAFTWASSDPGVATVDATGLVTALASGEATITASAGAVSGDAVLSVQLSFGSVSTAGGDACGVTTAEVGYCWGSNFYGQLGDGTTTERGTPGAVAGGLSFASVSAGGDHTCGVTTGGVAYCWGRNAWGQLGDGTTTDRTTPVPVAGGLTFETISAGGSPESIGSTCGVTTGGMGYCWGPNTAGQLGDGTFNDSSVPVLVLLP